MESEKEYQSTLEKPCLVPTERGFSVSYKGRFLYSKYSPDRAICAAIDSLTILPGTLILAASPLLWLGLNKLMEKLPEDSFILGLEWDKNLHELAEEKFKEIQNQKDFTKKICLLPYDQNEYIVNVLSGEISEEKKKILNIPHISTFRRAIILEMSAGTQFSKEKYIKTASLAQNTIASFWKNRITLTKFGRLFSRNLFKNLPKLESTLKLKNFIHKISKPIFIFGAGESIENILTLISKENLEKCFILSVDAASPVLKAYDIKIDAICAVEGQLAIEKAYIGGSGKDSVIIADICSRKQVTRHGKETSYFATKFTDTNFLNEISKEEFFPPLIPPMGSVGLTAVYIALLLRENINIPVFIAGLDFSFSLGRTHAKNTPAHIARLASSNHFSGPENYSAAFRTGAKVIMGKNNIPVFTDTALEGYAKSFYDFFSGTPNLYDCSFRGIPLGLTELSPEKLNAYLLTIKEDNKNIFFPSNEKKGDKDISQIRKYLEEEESALNRIKELLMYGNDVASCSMTLEEELKSLISCREYLYLHFPDGYKCNIKDLSFLKRIRSQLDFFLKDIKAGIKELSC